MFVKDRLWNKDCEGKIVKWRVWTKDRLWKKDSERKIVKGRLKDIELMRADVWKRKPAEVWEVIFAEQKKRVTEQPTGWLIDG